ncbi:hypothetical protein Mapa_013809 [Marchantia paleacea]|nr:hypothetical protein Mapa_013809 [Marchantia paleacea]
MSRTITFSGLLWTVRDTSSTTQGPGNNWWSNSTSNVWLDSNGRLHLKITKVGTKWLCPEVYTTGNYKYGKFNWKIEGPVTSPTGSFDKNVVLGLFTYPVAGADGTNEIDIELARWGNQSYPNLNFTSYPNTALSDFKNHTKSTEMALNGNYTSHQFEWRNNNISWVSRHGHSATGDIIFSESYNGDGNSQRIPQQDCKIHMNLWLFQGQAPTDGVQVEFVIHSFTYTS